MVGPTPAYVVGRVGNRIGASGSVTERDSYPDGSDDLARVRARLAHVPRMLVSFARCTVREKHWNLGRLRRDPSSYVTSSDWHQQPLDPIHPYDLEASGGCWVAGATTAGAVLLVARERLATTASGQARYFTMFVPRHEIWQWG